MSKEEEELLHVMLNYNFCGFLKDGTAIWQKRKETAADSVRNAASLKAQELIEENVL